ncbi:MAG TPA: glycoside hydrolase family 38 C-terminal domain-containing protein [Phycisphaerae bacterium]|nr:glycoside hydrolase family 38 C-terminal domain-containing protein [Phycisphaerae bacterium]HRW52833.1 glycoside hydrolase family 38 C-terminal domain-containing protein [Phycisphaerae bacterium]
MTPQSGNRAARLAVAMASVLLVSQSALSRIALGETVLPGYEKRTRGETLKYHSPVPDVTTGLLLRSADARRSIEWQTANAPAEIDGDFVQFVWLFAIDVNPEKHHFQLSIDGKPCFDITNPPTNTDRDWTLIGPDGATLRFRATMIDRFDDLMGYAILRVPRSMLTPGRPLTISVVGESADSSVWFIVFASGVSERAELSVIPALLRSEQGDYRPVTISITHLGAPTSARIETNFGDPVERDLQLGGNRIELRHAEVTEKTPLIARIHINGKERYRLEGAIEPVRPWTIDFVQHTHTDVGYTRPQTEILPEHLRFIDTALDYCDKTDGYPDDARFRWTCEASWAVREYLESRTPAQIERLRKRVEEGRIEVTGMFLNMSEVMDEASYAAFLQPIRMFRERGLRVTTAMQNDINGAAWCLADYFADIGVDYLVMGQHGHRALAPFGIATSFWWESPAGHRVLAFRADHYQTGNFWGVHTGKIETAEGELLHYLTRIERAGYPFDRIAIQHSGYITDNSPPSTASSDFVKAWNEKYARPHLRCAIARDFPEYVKQNHASELPVRRLAWPDWWTDGFGSAARESAAARLTQSNLVAAESLLAMESAMGLAVPRPMSDEIADIQDDLIFYGEHTFGSAESIRTPLNENSVVQWAEKSAYAWDAVKRTAVLIEGAMGRLAARVGVGADPELLVVNTLNFARSGVLELYVDHEVWPIDRPFRVLDETGAEQRVQLLRSREEGSYWSVWASDIPAFGWRTFKVEVAPSGDVTRNTQRIQSNTLENAYYRIEVDETCGAIKSLIDKSRNRELVDQGAAWKLGQIVYESLANREQLEAFMLTDYERRSLSDVVVEGVTDGPVFSTLSVRGEMPFCEGPGGVRCDIRLFHAAPRVELHYTLQKRRNNAPEGIYVAFPFGPEDGRILFETLGGVAEPARDILPGAASDWQTMQGFAGVRWPATGKAREQVVVSSDEIPLVQFGEINLGKFQRETKVARPHIFSWVMNNYWTTNFKASQEGEFRFSYALTSETQATRSSATRFGASHRIPFLGRVLPGRGAGRPLASNTVLPIDTPNLILIAARPASDGDGLILHLREVEGQTATIDTSAWTIGGAAARVREVNVLGLPMNDVSNVTSFAPFETKFLLLEALRQ